MATTHGTEFTRGLSGELLDRLPPQNLDAERNVLASLLLDPDLCDDVAPILHADDFYSDAHQKLFAQLIAMHSAGERIDATLLVERLRSANLLEAVGGLSYLGDLFAAGPVAVHAEYYARIVRDKATLRSLIHASAEILRDSYDQAVEPGDQLSRAEEKIFAIRDARGTGDLFRMEDVLQEAMDRIDRRLDHEQMADCVPSGFTDLDNLLAGGLHNSELVILAARPSMGKTALATNIADHVSRECKLPSLFVSLEMSRLELAERMLCSHAKINSHRLRTGHPSAQDHRKLAEASAELSQASLFIDDSPSRNMSEIAAAARRLKRRHDLALIVVDYLQLIAPDDPREPRQEQVSRIARRLKGMARELRVPVLCLAQLNRQAEQSKDNRPRLSHLRESGAIEQDADVVMFVHREEYFRSSEEDRADVAGRAEVIVAKQRNGPTGEVHLTWLKEFTRFENAAAAHYEDFPSDF